MSDFKALADVLLRKKEPSLVPFYEHFVDGEVVAAIMHWDIAKTDMSSREGLLSYWKNMIEFYRQMGYDYLPMEFGPRFAARQSLIGDDTALLNRGKRGWVDEHGGPIQTWKDLKNDAYWPDADHVFDYELFESICKLLPEGMKIIGGASGGPFEHASFLMGLSGLCMMMVDDPEFAEELFTKIGTSLVEIAKRLAPIEGLGAYRFGDDLGFKTATMLSPAALRKYVFPWQKKVVEAVHAAGKPFILHSCGQLEKVMDDLIDDVGIDAKHSFEDVIMPVQQAKARWGNRVSILGGVDVDFLCRHTPGEIREHTKRILESCAPGGGYALGSGNTIANYVPVENYLAMIQAGREFNGQA